MGENRDDRPQKDLARREELSSENTRARRDLDAVCIGLSLYYLAGATMEANGEVGTLHMKFSSPCVFVYIAWCAYVYFLIRYWMFAPTGVWKMFLEDARWQAGATGVFRSIARELVPKVTT